MTEIASSVMEKTSSSAATATTESTVLTSKKTTIAATRGSSFAEFTSHSPRSSSPLPALSPLFRKAGSLWHPHVYAMPPKQPTPFSIDFILNGNGSSRGGQHNGTFREACNHCVDVDYSTG